MRKTWIFLLALVAAGCAHQVKFTQPPKFGARSVDNEAVYQGAVQDRAKEFDSILKLCAARRDSLGREYNRLSRISWHWDFWTSCLCLGSQAAGSIIISTGGSERASRNVSIIGASAIAVSLGVKTAGKLGTRSAECLADYHRQEGFVENAMDEFTRMQRFLDSPDSLRLLDDLLVKLRRQSGQFLTPKGR